MDSRCLKKAAGLSSVGLFVLWLYRSTTDVLLVVCTVKQMTRKIRQAWQITMCRSERSFEIVDTYDQRPHRRIKAVLAVFLAAIQ
jgi:hypothetical protein